MSKTKKILELEPDGRTHYESFVFKDFKCPHCSGRGSFINEVGRNEQKETICPFCNGAGKVMCSVVTKWSPQYEDFV